MKTAATIALFCAGGGLTRYYLSGWIYGLLGRAFPYGTLVVNIIGAYCIGLIMELGLRSTMLSDTLRIGLTVGFMGGLTTFSTFTMRPSSCWRWTVCDGLTMCWPAWRSVFVYMAGI